MKEYIFENSENPNIRITIKATSLIEAVEVLQVELKHPNEYDQLTLVKKP